MIPVFSGFSWHALFTGAVCCSVYSHCTSDVTVVIVVIVVVGEVPSLSSEVMVVVVVVVVWLIREMREGCVW